MERPYGQMVNHLSCFYLKIIILGFGILGRAANEAELAFSVRHKLEFCVVLPIR
jgi:hypothetical protein